MPIGPIPQLCLSLPLASIIFHHPEPLMPPRTRRSTGTAAPMIPHGINESNGPIGNVAQSAQNLQVATPGVVNAVGTRPTRKSTKLPILL